LASTFAGTISIWDIATGIQIAQSSGGHNAGVIAYSWSPDGTMVASGGGSLGEDFTVRICDASTGEQSLVLDGHRNDVFALSWRADGQRLFSISFDNTLRIWSMPEGDIIRVLNLPTMGNPERVAISPDGTMLALIVDDDTVQIWSLIDENSE
jgi:WD40 repeat protein